MIGQKRNGAVLPLVAVVSAVLILVLGLAVELNWLYSTRFEAQSASDLAARSALAILYANEDELDDAVVARAKAFGVKIYGMNFEGSAPITEAGLSFGRLDDSDFNEITGGGNLRNITASRVIHGQEFVSLLGSLISKNDVELGVFSIAEASKVDMVLVLDASRSMNFAADSSNGSKIPGTSIHEPPGEGSRWFALKAAVDDFLTGLAERDKNQGLGLVTFGGGLPHKIASPLDAEFSRIELEIDTVESVSGGVLGLMDEYTALPALGLGTSIYDGITDSLTLFERQTVPAKRYMILFTDGAQAVRESRPSELVAAWDAADAGVTIFTIGYELDGGNLAEIADITGGQNFSVSSLTELQNAFRDITALLQTRIVE